MRTQGSGRLAFCLLILGVMGPAANAAEPAPRRLSLAEAIGIALKSNRTLRAATLERLAAESEVGVARGALLPRLDAIENYSATDNPVLVFSDLLLQQEFSQNDFALPSLNHPGAFSNFQSQIQLSFPVYAGGRLLAAFKAAKFGADAERWRETRARDQTAFAAIQAYYAAALAEERMNVVERALAAARAHLTEARDLFAHGMAVNADVLRTRVLAGSLEEQRTDARSRLRIAWAALAHVLGDEGERLAPMPLPANAPAAPLARLADLSREAIAARPELKIAAASVGRAEQAVTIARADYLPSINVAAAYENDSEKIVRAGNNFAVFAYARMNLFNGLATRSRVGEAMARLERAKTLAEDLKHAIALEVESVRRALEAARQNLEVARRNYSYAADALKILEDRYGMELATNVAVLDAQTARQQADLERTRARIAAMMEQAALDLAIGRMPAAAKQ